MKILEFGENGQERDSNLSQALRRKDKGLYTIFQLPPGNLLLRRKNEKTHKVRESVNASLSGLLETST